ncbi:hypothetical protein [Occultella kanbiaonis]|uniref:hypothetical protein n=1 Tax=Occultella kanbiaonis TaxID=2675754 RepID=UPI0013D846CF|nr:hypothetical protein [Occultella kanbiaonis]
MTLQGAGGPGGYGYHQPPPVRTSTTGPRILTFAGIVVVLAAVAIVLLVALAAASARSVLAPDGSPGDVVTLAVDAPGEGVLELEIELGQGQTHQVFLAYPSRDPVPELSGEILVHGPFGHSQPVLPFGGEVTSAGGVSAHLAGVFSTLVPGEYRIEVPATVDGSPVTVLIRPATDSPGLADGFRSGLTRQAATFLGLLGAAMGVGGGIWWRRRAAARRRAAGP